MTQTAPSRTTVLWVLRLVAAGLLGFFGILKLIAHPAEVSLFDELGLGHTGMIAAGIAEMVAVVLLLWPRWSPFGALLGLGVMGGAIHAHATVLGFGSAWKAFLVIGACVGIVWIQRARVPLLRRLG